MGITLTLTEVRNYYLHFTGFEMPTDISYTEAARNIIRDFGEANIKKLQREERMKLEEGGD